MKIKMSLLKKIIKESVLLEQMTKSNEMAKFQLTRGAVRASTAMKSKDNPNALQILPDDRAKIEVTLTVAKGSKYYGKPHFIWSESKFGTGASDKLYVIGSLTNGNGDPFTYEKVSGNKYRVISGPVSKTIGKTFTLDPVPTVPVPPLKPDAPDTEDATMARTDTDPSKKTNVAYERRKEATLKVMDQMIKLSDSRINKKMIGTLKSQLESDQAPLDKVLQDLDNPKLVGLTKDELRMKGILISGI
jgi:hypothetical protein